MLLAIDVGNTTTVYGVYQQETLIARWSVSTDAAKTVDELGMMLDVFMRRQGITFKEIEGMAIASVVPTLLPNLVGMAHSYFHLDPLVVGPGVKSGIPIRFGNPREVGADRICNAVATVHKYGGPAIIVDFGTSTNFDAISKAGEYLGGAIAPGIALSMEALFHRASRLPQVELGRPKSVIGRSTSDCIQAGIFYGFYGQVKEIIGQMSVELGGSAVVVATGHLSKFFATTTDLFQYVEENLTLDGLRLIYAYNQE